MADQVIYEERVSSNKTQALFLALTALFAGLYARRRQAGRRGWLTAMLDLLAWLFGFYVFNYRTLVIQLTFSALTLTFGVFRWVVPLANVAACGLDDLPTAMRFGGAGIHFMLIRGRYRASFNFLEHPRVVIAFRQPVGPVRDLSFSTQHPEELCRLIQAATAGT